MKTRDYTDWIGRTRQDYDSMAAETMKRFAATMNRDPARVMEDDPLTPCAHWFYFTPMEPLSELAPDGHPHKGGFLPPIDLPRRMWAGGRVRPLAPLRTGTPATKTSTITKIESKEGRSGALCFITVVHRVEQDGRLCVEEEQDIVYREAAPEGIAPRRNQPLDQRPDWSIRWEPASAELFRFSAITFNAHRIHYDVDYCRQVEGYPNVVVHGPLLLHRIVNSFSEKYSARCITAIRYRAVGPVYLGERVQIGGTDGPIEPKDGFRSGCTNMTVFGEENTIAMQADINWEEGTP